MVGSLGRVTVLDGGEDLPEIPTPLLPLVYLMPLLIRQGSLEEAITMLT